MQQPPVVSVPAELPIAVLIKPSIPYTKSKTPPIPPPRQPPRSKIPKAKPPVPPPRQLSRTKSAGCGLTQKRQLIIPLSRTNTISNSSPSRDTSPTTLIKNAKLFSTLKKRKETTIKETSQTLEQEVLDAEESFMRTKREAREEARKKLCEIDESLFDDDDGKDYGTDLFNVPDYPRLITMCGKDHYYEIRSATLYKLIERVTSPVPEFIAEYNHFLKIFFMTYRSFATPQQVFSLLTRRFNGYDNMGEEINDWAISYSNIKQGVCFSVSHWFYNHYRDFSINTMLKKALDKFISTAKESEDPNLKRFPVKEMESIIAEKSEVGSYPSFFSIAIDSSNFPPSILPKNLETAKFLDVDELEIARQLTLEEYNIYAEIKPEELQELAWSKPRLKHRAPNILQIINRFNHISEACATALINEPKLRTRKKVLEKIIKILEHLESMNSFNMMMALLSAFGQSAIHRLKFTWEAIKPRYLELAQKYQTLFNAEGNYKNYRSRIKEVKKPIIPFLGVYMTDLTFVDEGNPETLDNRINFRKRQLEYDVIIKVLKYQDFSYQFKLQHKITTLLKNLPVLKEDELFEKSLLLEPRNSKCKDLK